MGASRRWGQRMPLVPGLASSPAPGILACRVLKQSLDHPERLLKQELPFSSHLVCCCRCLFGFGFILAVSFIFTFGGLFLLLKLTKQQAISLLYCIKDMNVSCSGLLKMGGNRSNIISLLVFFMINVVVTENRDYLTAEVALEHSWSSTRLSTH